MAEWQEAAATNDSTWDQKKPIEGKYIGNKKEVGPNLSMMYTIENEDGKTGVWGSTVLDSKFQEVPVGSMVRVEFLGMEKGLSGKEYKDYKVLYKDAPMTEAGAPTKPEDDTDLDKIPF